MNQNPLVTITIATYNQRDIVSRAIESVLSQTYQNIELLIGDDCSTDGTSLVVKQYAEMYPHKIKAIFQPNNIGTAKNVNSLLDIATGYYYTGIGGDDVLFPNKIEEQVSFFQQNPSINFSYHNLEAFDLATGEVLYYTHEKGRNKRNEGDFFHFCRFGIFFSTPSVMFVRFGREDLRHDERLPYASDWVFYTKALGKTGKAKYIDKVLGRYGRSKQSITISRPPDFQLEIEKLASVSILLVQYPDYSKPLLKRYAAMLFGLRFTSTSNYLSFVKSALHVDFNIKYLLVFIFFNVFRKML